MTTTTDTDSGLTDAEIKRLVDRELGIFRAALKSARSKPKFPWSDLFALTFSWALLLPLMYWRGYVIQKLWTWFVLPVYPSFVVPSIHALVGAALVLAAFLPRPVLDQNAKSYPPLSLSAMGFLWPLGMLAIGALWQWMGWGL